MLPCCEIIRDLSSIKLVLQGDLNSVTSKSNRAECSNFRIDAGNSSDQEIGLGEIEES